MNAEDPNRRRARKRSNGEGTISKRADGRYTAAIFVERPDGTRGRKWIYGRTRQDVADKLVELSQKVHSGVPVPTRSPSLSEFLHYWMTEVVLPRLRPTTIAKYRSTITLYIEPTLGRHKIEKITVQMVQQMLNIRREAGDSAAKLRMIREVLSSALGRAVREELIVHNVAQLTTIPPEHRARRIAWTAAQSRTFLTSARSDQAYPAFVLARSFERITRTAGLPAIAFHDLRRSAATLMKDLGIPARDAQAILGHSHVSVTLGIYSEVLDDAITQAGQRLNDALDTPPDQGSDHSE